jgi:hypothetical protein
MPAVSNGGWGNVGWETDSISNSNLHNKKILNSFGMLILLTTFAFFTFKLVIHELAIVIPS